MQLMHLDTEESPNGLELGLQSCSPDRTSTHLPKIGKDNLPLARPTDRWHKAKECVLRKCACSVTCWGDDCCKKSHTNTMLLRKGRNLKN